MTTLPRPIAALCLLALSVICHAAPGTVAARSRTISPHVTAYAQIVSSSRFQVRAGGEGVVSRLDAVPGDAAESGQTLAHLTGPAVDALLTGHRAEVAAAHAAVTGARKELAVDRKKRAERLGTRSAVFEAQVKLAEARARLKTANAALHAAKMTTTIQAPAKGTILSVDAPNGERVRKGQSVLTFQGRDGLWLKAQFYGTDARSVAVGRTGRFRPANGGKAIAVRVRGITGRVTPDGGEIVSLVPATDTADWRAGEGGTVTLYGTQHTVVTVPTRALILDRGQWWVLVADSQGERPRRVVPGEQRGASTVISHGLKAGEEVVVSDAYLHYHRDFAERYAQPD